MRGGAVTGQVVSKDDKSVTVKLADGSTKIVLLQDATTYRRQSEAKAEDMEAGSQIAVIGTANSDGSTTAKQIEINPILPVATETQ